MNRSRKFFVQVRRFHYLVGLFLLVELWLFAFSGLMLNHPEWEIAQFWGRRATTQREVPLPKLTASRELERAAELMKAVGVSGELESISWSSDRTSYTLNVARPGFISRVAVDTETETAKIEETSTDVFGIISILHTFNGVDLENGGRERDWFVTSLWTLTMDLLAAAIIFWALSGLYLWIAAGWRERAVGTSAVVVGLIVALFFLIGPA